jgi:hypothetical protein
LINMSDKQYICPSCAEVDGVPVRNVSGEVETIGDTTRHVERGEFGRFARKGSTQVRPLPMPDGPGGIDVTTGRWIAGVRRNDVLFRDRLSWDRVTHDTLDYSGHPAISSMLDTGEYPFHLRRKA